MRARMATRSAGRAWDEQVLPDLISDVQLVVIEGGPHAIAWTHADQVNDALALTRTSACAPSTLPRRGPR
jgi:pimeloyl-ACP methyl ester carboxylesterase